MSETDFGRESGIMDLENGLRIHFYDQSRPIAGDRRFVKLLVRIPVPLLEEYLVDSGDSPAEYRPFIGDRGKEVDFVQAKIRNFVDASKAPALLEALKEEFLRANLIYLSKPSFPRLFVSKEYQAWKETTSWRAAHRRQLEAVEQKEREPE